MHILFKSWTTFSSIWPTNMLKSQKTWMHAMSGQIFRINSKLSIYNKNSDTLTLLICGVTVTVCLLYLGTKRKPNLVNLTTKDFVNPLQTTTSHHIASIASSDLNNTVQLVDIYNSSVACLWMSWIRVIPADGILLRTSEEEEPEDRSQPPEDLRLR